MRPGIQLRFLGRGSISTKAEAKPVCICAYAFSMWSWLGKQTHTNRDQARHRTTAGTATDGVLRHPSSTNRSRTRMKVIVIRQPWGLAPRRWMSALPCSHESRSRSPCTSRFRVSIRHLFRVQESCRLRPEVPVALGRSRQASMAPSLR